MHGEPKSYDRGEKTLRNLMIKCNNKIYVNTLGGRPNWKILAVDKDYI